MHSTEHILASHPAAPGSIPSVPEFFSGEIIDVAEVNQQCWLAADRTHLVLASGKPQCEVIYLRVLLAGDHPSRLPVPA